MEEGEGERSEIRDQRSEIGRDFVVAKRQKHQSKTSRSFGDL